MAIKTDIVTNFNGNSTGFVTATQKANRALATHSKQIKRTSTQGRMAFQNLVYGVEDVASTIGTGGLAGATRAASNNITMIAMALGGPWGMAAGVAITTTVQLALAFGAFGEAAKKSAKEAEEALERFKTALDKSLTQARSYHDFNTKITEGTLDERAAATKAAEKEVETQRAAVTHLEKHMKLRLGAQRLEEQKIAELEKERDAILNTGAANEYRIKLKQKEIDAVKGSLEEKRKESDEIGKALDEEGEALYDLIKMREWARKNTSGDARLKEIQDERKAADEASKSGIENIKIEADFRSSLSGRTKKEIQERIDLEQKAANAIKEQISAAEGAFNSHAMQMEVQSKLREEQEAAERRIAIAKEEQKDAANEELKIVKAINQELNASVDGSKEFAKAFQSVVNKTEDVADLPADLDMKPAADGGWKNPSARATFGNSGFERFMKAKGESDPAVGFGEFGSPFDEFMANKKSNPNLGQGIDDFTKRRKMEEAKRPAPAIEEFKKQKDAEFQRRLDEFNKESKKTAANTKTTNDILSEIASNLESGTSLEVTVGGILT